MTIRIPWWVISAFVAGVVIGVVNNNVDLDPTTFVVAVVFTLAMVGIGLVAAEEEAAIIRRRVRSWFDETERKREAS